MTTTLSPLALQRFFDSNGAPLAGGQLSTYLAGTNTPTPTYTDSTGSTPNTNPIILDASGQANVWLDPSVTYKFVLQSSVSSGSVLQWTVDNIVPAVGPAQVQSTVNSIVGGISLRNVLHNGNFFVNQRNVSGTVTLAAGATGHDRWKAGAGGCTYTFLASGNDTVITITSGSLMQVVEDKNVAGGVYALANRGTAQARVAVNGTSTSGAYSVASTTAPLLSASANGGQTITVEFTTGTLDRVQLETGSSATSFERRPYGLELVMCQRYLPAFNATTGSNDDVAWGGTTSTSTGAVSYQFLVEPRIAPTGIAVNNVANFSLTSMTATSVTTAITFSGAGKRMCRMNVTGTGTPYTQSQPVILVANSASGQILFTGAEL